MAKSFLEFLIPQFGAFKDQQRAQDTISQLIPQLVGNQSFQTSLAPPQVPEQAGGGELDPSIASFLSGGGELPNIPPVPGGSVQFSGPQGALPVNPTNEAFLQLLQSENPGLQQAGLKGAFSQLPLPVEPDATSLVQNLQAAGLNQGTPEFQEVLLSILQKPDVQINQGTKPLSISDLKQLRTPDNEILPPGSTLDDARLANAKVIDKPTEGEAQKEAQREIGFSMLDEIEGLAKGTHPSFPGQIVDISPGASALTRSRAGVGALGEFGALVTPGDITEPEAKMISLSEALSNQLLAAMRGAQVGPKEQERFDRQLPRMGQNTKLFLQNIKATRKNLKTLQRRIKQLRGGAKTTLPPLPPGSAGIINQ